MMTKGGQKSHKNDDVFYERPLGWSVVDPCLYFQIDGMIVVTVQQVNLPRLKIKTCLFIDQ